MKFSEKPDFSEKSGFSECTKTFVCLHKKLKKEEIMKKVFAGLALAMTVMCSALSFAEILIVANKDVPETALNVQEVQEIFLGKRVQWRDNSRIRFVTVGDSGIHGLFLKEYVKLSEADWKIYWKRMVFTGRGLPPATIATEAEVIAFVAETKGAVGYVSSDGLPEKSEKDSVKIIDVR
ncbi:MAG: substrate-binding domain-containing protein [Desulfobacterales bacterium]